MHAVSERPSSSARGLSVPKITWRPLGGFLGPNAADAGQSLIALAFSALTSVVAGLTLASREDQLRSLPGLLLFIPAAIGLRGNVFGPLGSRLSTALQTGQFTWSWRIDSLLGQNIVATFVNSLAAGLGLAGAAEVMALVIERGDVIPISFADFIVVSIIGGLLASVVVLVATLGLTVASVRFDWDLDNVTAPMVTAVSDLITLPALVVSTVLVRAGNATVVVSSIAAAVTLFSLYALWRSGLNQARRIVAESLPVLIGAGILSLFAGVAIERFSDRLSWVMLVLLPGYLGTAGALGGILANRLSTQIHLGLVDRTLIPSGNARSAMGVTMILAVPIFVLLALIAESAALINDQTSPGLLLIVAVALSGGAVVTLFALAFAYYGTLLVVRFGLDPDNLGIPLVTASLDVMGALTLVAAVVVWGA
jgi:mgtE-like transporter